MRYDSFSNIAIKRLSKENVAISNDVIGVRSARAATTNDECVNILVADEQWWRRQYWCHYTYVTKWKEIGQQGL